MGDYTPSRMEASCNCPIYSDIAVTRPQRIRSPVGATLLLRVTPGEPKQKQSELKGEPRQRLQFREIATCRQERGGSGSHAAFPQTTTTAEPPHNKGPKNTADGSGTSGLRNLSIFLQECGEAHNLLPFEEPVDFGVKCGGNCLPQRIPRLPASVYDPAEIGLVDANHLGEPVLPNPCLVDR
jgi:hypothetical protein